MSLNLSVKETTPKKETTEGKSELVLMDGSNDNDEDEEEPNVEPTDSVESVAIETNVGNTYAEPSAQTTSVVKAGETVIDASSAKASASAMPEKNLLLNQAICHYNWGM